MKIGLDRVLQLARLNLTVEQRERLEGQLDKIVSYFENLRELNTDQIAPTFHAFERQNVFRDDCAVAFSDREKILQNACEREEDFFKVKRIIEEI